MFHMFYQAVQENIKDSPVQMATQPTPESEVGFHQVATQADTQNKPSAP